MNRRIAPALCRAALAACLAAVAIPPASAEGQCYGDWSDAAPIVAKEKLLSARDVQDLARHEHGGDAVRIILCEQGGGFIYRVTLRRLDGHIGMITVGAIPGNGR